MTSGKLIAGSRVDVAKAGVGVFVGTGSPKPDISSVETFKRPMLAAKSISYSDPAGGGISGIHMASVVERLGIAAEMKPKTKLFQNSQAALQALVKGDAEIGFGLTSDAAATSGVDLVGPLPPEVQSFTLYAAGLIASGKQAEAAKATSVEPQWHRALRRRTLRIQLAPRRHNDCNRAWIAMSGHRRPPCVGPERERSDRARCELR
jgi:molybdate transport system substrate-binding protein